MLSRMESQQAGEPTLAGTPVALTDPDMAEQWRQMALHE